MITVQVPGEKVKCLGDLQFEKLNTLLFCGQVGNQSQPGESCFFGSVQAAFGTACSNPSQGQGLPTISVKEGKADWSGSTPLVVSFHAPTWLLIKNPIGLTAAISLRPTKEAILHHTGDLGMGFEIHRTTLPNEANVLLSKFLPNLSGPPRLAGGHNIGHNLSGFELSAPLCYITTDSDNTRIETLTRRIDLEGEHRELLADKSIPLKTILKQPLSMSVGFAAEAAIDIGFPVPVSAVERRLRLARTSGYIEVIASTLTAGLGLPRQVHIPVGSWTPTRA